MTRGPELPIGHGPRQPPATPGRSPRRMETAVPTFGPPVPDHAGAPNTLAPRIVIADDEAHIRLVVGEKFRSEGCVVMEARDGEEALEIVRVNTPHLLVTDLQMPYLNGLELCTQLAADPRTAGVPAILLTARGHIVEESQLAKSCIRKVMSKPFSAKLLFEQAVGLLSSTFGQGVAPAPLGRTSTARCEAA